MSTVDRLLGTPLVEQLGSRATASRVRILAYHGVPDAVAFARQLDHLAEHYQVVSGRQVVAALDGAPLPRRAVWITFDDGRPDVVEAGLPELARRSMVATLFVCPGLLDPPRPFWWSEVEAALAAGPVQFEGRAWTDRSLVTRLKQVPDATRRSVLADLDATPTEGSSLGTAELRTWLDAGQEVGNHTWDHPCLDQCSPDEQRRQITEAHEALTGVLGEPPDLFAYPNGDVTPEAAEVLRSLGYSVALAFDHRLTRLGGDRWSLSRLRLDSDAPLDRARAILGGGHSGLFHARAGARRLLARAS